MTGHEAQSAPVSASQPLTVRAIPPKRPKSNSGHRCVWCLFVSPGTCALLIKTKGNTMSRRCELTGKGPMSGNTVSHANNKSRRRWLPNLNEVTLMSETLNRGVKLRISAAALRSVDHRGGIDAFLAKAKDDELSANAMKIKKEIAKATVTAAAAAATA